jgi:A/G-specific adenine glycosylase
VSEIMLQQTQVSRVNEKYKEFIAAFPTVEALARAPLSDVLRVWQGLGYNRRAKFLKQTAEVIMSAHAGDFPQTIEKLSRLPGIGKATAAAVLTYAFNKPIPYLETNIRTILIFHFFPRKKKIHDKELFPLAEQLLDRKNPREWHWALMDYGTYVKKLRGNFSQRSSLYTKQSKFEGSRRQKRSRIIKILLLLKKASAQELVKQTGIDSTLLEELLRELEKEAMIERQNKFYQLSS